MPIFSVDMQDSLMESTQQVLDVPAKNIHLQLNGSSIALWRPELRRILEHQEWVLIQGCSLDPMQKLITLAMDAACKPASGAQGRNGTEFSTPGSECVLPLALKYFNAKALISGNNWK